MKIRIPHQAQDINFGKNSLARQKPSPGVKFWSSGNRNCSPLQPKKECGYDVLWPYAYRMHGPRENQPERKASWVFSACLPRSATGQNITNYNLTFQNPEK